MYRPSGGSTVTAERGAVARDAVEPPVIEVRGLRKTFRRTGDEEVRAVDDVSLTVARGEMVVLLGPSGCGKTTLLRCIAGLEQADDGECRIDGRVMSAPGRRTVPPEARNIGMMFQSYALWPHMTVRKNVAYPLETRRVGRAEIASRVQRILSIVGIDALIDQHPTRLSGGQQQRVALARSLVAEPRVMLFDEPLSNVDAKVRVQLRNEIVEMQRRLGFAGIYVTHDQEEAMQLADRLAVMDAGRIVQLDAPRVVYRQPATNYVAEFVGAVNRWPARPVPGAGEIHQFDVTGLGRVEVAAANVAGRPATDAPCWLLARPEAFAITEAAGRTADRPNTWVATVVRESFAGAHTEYVVELDGGGRIRLSSFDADGSACGEGARVLVSVDPGRLRLLTDDHTDGHADDHQDDHQVDGAAP